MGNTILTDTLTAEEEQQVLKNIEDKGVIEVFILEGLHGIKAIQEAQAEILSKQPRWIRPVWVFNGCTQEAA